MLAGGVAALLLLLGGPEGSRAAAGVPVPAGAVDQLANQLDRLWTQAVADDRLPDNSLAALGVRQAAEDRLYRRFMALPVPAQGDERVTYEVLRESLEASRDVRACHTELWDVNHISGWQISLPALASRQPVGTARARDAAVRRWSSFPHFVAVEIANLRAGLARGYSVPRPVVARVIRQLDAALAEPTDRLAYSSPALRDGDRRFRAEFLAVVEEKIRPALSRYRTYLAAHYLPRARSSIGVSALPDGRRCYRALLRRETTLGKSPRQVFDEGRRMIAENRAGIEAIGGRLFGTRDVSAILAQAQSAPDNRFGSAAEEAKFVRGFVARARERSASLFTRLPDAELVVEPFPDYQKGSGMSPYYEPAKAPGEPSRYMFNPETWQDDTRGFAEVVAVHEGWPGHHLQDSIARSIRYRNRFREHAVYAAFAEGWARYVERLADETGIYDTPYARIAWRIKPGFGMVVDPGVHWFGWSRARAARFLKSSGLFPSQQSVEDMIDRIAVMPAQLTAYDTGGSEFVHLRDEARRRLGPRFDVRRFHAALLSMGFVPLSTLDRRMSAWIGSQVAGPDGAAQDPRSPGEPLS
jgi:uncharacterized protein (DUF885 family)